MEITKENNVTPELTKAKYAVWDYYKKHKLDPGKDYTKDPVHGETLTRLILKLNKERDKELLRYPARDLKHQLKFSQAMKKNKEAKKAKKKAQVADVENTKKSSKKAVVKEEKKPAAKKATKYDYPLVDGKEMTPEQKKKYRMEQRKLKAGDAPKVKKEKEKVEKTEAPVPKKEKKVKKVKKAHRDED